MDCKIGEIVAVKKVLLLALVALAAWFFWPEAKANWKGMPAAHDPVQMTASLPAPFKRGDYTITPLANYKVTAVVLSRETYGHDRESQLSPIDLALGWGPMSIAGVINELHISQSGRWYEYRWSNEPPLKPDQIVSHSANTHCLPADDNVRTGLLAVKRHDLVTLEGYLVQVDATDDWHWRSSLTRTDTGAHACEVFWITGVSRKPL